MILIEGNASTLQAYILIHNIVIIYASLFYQLSIWWRTLAYRAAHRHNNNDDGWPPQTGLEHMDISYILSSHPISPTTAMLNNTIECWACATRYLCQDWELVQIFDDSWAVRCSSNQNRYYGLSVRLCDLIINWSMHNYTHMAM